MAEAPSVERRAFSLEERVNGLCRRLSGLQEAVHELEVSMRQLAEIVEETTIDEEDRVELGSEAAALIAAAPDAGIVPVVES